MTFFDPAPLRAQFPALAQNWHGQPALFLDSPGGTQVPDRVIEAVARYYRESNSNAGGTFPTGERTDVVIAGARQAVADLLNAPSPETIVFGPNMTSLAFHLAHSVAETLRPGDEVIVTSLDHDANVTPWTNFEAVGAVVKRVDFHTEDCTLDMDSLRAAITERTRWVAITHAANAVGTIPDVAAITRLAHEVGAWVFVDAVQFAPHGPIDVQAMDCDFLACSAYKFFGPHAGVLYAKAEHLARLKPEKVRPAMNVNPTRWETGTQNHEGMAGVAAAVDYLAEVGERFGGAWREEYARAGYGGRRLTLKTAMRAVREYEKTLSARLITGLQALGDVRIYGITDLSRLEERLPTVAFTWTRYSPRATAEKLGANGIATWSGNYYALCLMERLGLQDAGGAVRVGPVHFNTLEEIDRLLTTLERL